MPKRNSWKDDDIWMADFETAPANDIPRGQPGHAERVWLWVAVKCYDTSLDTYGYDISTFVKWLGEGRKVVYFHNLKWDGSFILSYLLEHEGQELWREAPAHQVEPYERPKHPGEWTAFIDDRKKAHYYYTLGVSKGVVEIRDSFKIIPESVKRLGKASGNEKEHLEDYDRVRPAGYAPTPEEIEYCTFDCLAVIPHIVSLREMGLDKLTAGSNAMKWLKQEAFGNNPQLRNGSVPGKRFAQVFPGLTPLEWNFDQQAYTGGLCFVNPKYKEKQVHNVISLDANSLYPSRMALCPLPYGRGMPFIGKPVSRPGLVWIAKVRCCFQVKPDRFPFLHKGWSCTRATMLTHSGQHEALIEPMEMVVSSVDWETMNRQYEIWGTRFLGGYYYKSTTRWFQGPVEKLYAYKQQASAAASTALKNGDKTGYYRNTVKKETIKRILNNIYGKFGQAFNGFLGKPELEEGAVKYEEIRTNEDPEPKDAVLTYIPVAVFTTAYGRQWLLENLEKHHDRFVYCDTDSMHMWLKEGEDPKEVFKDIPQDQTKLGYFKNETPDTIRKLAEDRKVSYPFSSYPTGVYLHPKAYAHFDEKGKQIDLTCAGLIPDARKGIDLQDWHMGATIKRGRTRPVQTEGGVYLKYSDYNIKEVG